MLKWWDKYQELSQDGRPFVLATVVKSVGSTPRKPGTKMLIESSGRFWGTIGGGQLEVLVLAEAAKALAAGEGRLARFDLCPRTGQCCGGSTEVFWKCKIKTRGFMCSVPVTSGRPCVGL